MVDIEHRQSRLTNKPATTINCMQQPLRPKRVEKLVKKFENCQTPPLVPPPIAFKAPPTPPPVEQLDNSPGLSEKTNKKVTCFSAQIRARARVNVQGARVKGHFTR